MPAPRQDIYTGIHKAIRALLFDIAATVRTTDAASAEETSAVAARLAHVVELVEEHGRHEEQFIHPQVAAVEPALVADLESAHAALDGLLDQLRAALHDLAQVDDDGRPGAWAAVDRTLSRWVGGHLQHMADEEERILPATWAWFDDAAIVAMRTKIQLDTAPERYVEWLHWFARGMSRPEVLALLRASQHTAPPEVFQAMLAVVRDALPDSWPQVQAALAA